MRSLACPRMKSAPLVASLISALLFASLHALPEVDPQSAPKAFAAGLGMLPRIAGLLLCAAISIIFIVRQIRRTGAWRTFQHPITWVSLILLLPAAYTLAFMLLFLVAHL